MIDPNSSIEIYTVRGCIYCSMAKELLESKGLRYTEYDVKAGSREARAMMRRSRSNSVPQIFIDGEFIGGGHELAELLDGTRES